MVITVAVDHSPDDAREWIEAASPTHPSVIDTDHVVVDRYGMVNVPTIVWIDESGTLVSPCDVQFATDTFLEFHGRPSGPYLDAIRSWVRDGRLPYDSDDAIRAAQMLPTEDEQLARTHFVLASFLHARAASGETEAAAKHFDRAVELAPYDFTVRRAAMPIRGVDPMGEAFFAFYQEWQDAGSPGYDNQNVGLVGNRK